MKDGFLGDLVWRQAAATPDAVAVVDGERTLTYAQLTRRAARLAHLLGEWGIGRGDVVCLNLPRGADFIVALLGIWRGGAAYLPTDPEHPRERRDRILRDARPAIVLTPELLRSLPTPEAGQVPVAGADAAYVIYTSGSTGRPKGVVVTHEGIANRVLWTTRTHELGPYDRLLHKTSVTFDAAGWEMIAPLLSGGTVVIAPPGAERDPASLVRLMREHEITVLQVVPSLLRELVREPGWTGLASLRLLFSAGEPLHAGLVREAALPSMAIWNTYGPTECAIDVTAHQVDPDQPGDSVPIGRPISGMRVRVLDEEGGLAPIGVPGELCAGGPGVGRGYLGMPAMTAERFVPDPYGEGERLYRTGDLVRWSEDGVLHFMGRLDEQLKVNGVRVEPAEIEAVLQGHPAVAAVAVVASEGRLVAHVAGRVAPAELRLFARDVLPDTHVPTRYVLHDKLPVLPSGKIDRSALKAPVAPAAHTPPSTPAEHRVAAVWSELLGVERIGADDDFFQRGGTSLLLTKLANRLDVPVPDLYAVSTVAGQAELLDRQGATAERVGPAGHARSAEVSYGQRRLWFLDRIQPGSPEWVAPLFVRLENADAGTVRAALNRLAERHEILRTRYVPVAGEPRQIIDDPAPVELRVAAAGEDPAALVAGQLARGFDLERGPVWRAMLAGDLLLITIHHIACDGWSTVVLDRELRALCAGADLPPVPLQYADYAAWQRRALTAETLADDLAHWREHLAGVPVLELPTDRPRPAHRDHHGAMVTFDIPAELGNALAAWGRERGATLTAVLMTAWAMLLSRHSGQRDFAVGTPVAGRERAEFGDVVGFFLNALALRMDLTGNPTFEEAVARVNAACRAGFARQRLPFDRLVEELQPGRDLTRTPIYQVSFDLHEAGHTDTALEAADASVMAEAWLIAKTDLSLLAQRRPDGSVLASLEYATALFDRATATTMAARFLKLLRDVAAQPRLRLSAVDLADFEHPARLGGLPARCVHEVFQEQAARTPGAPAVDGMTYGELNARANHLARHLRARGAGPGKPVGVCLEHGPDLIITLLAVLKSGAAYLPLDPDQPAERLAFMIEDAGAALVVTTTGLAGKVTEPAVLLDTLAPGSAPDDPAAAAAPDDVVYVIYTSGSTGRPKGVEVTHANVLRLFTATEAAFSFGPGDVWTLFHSYAFDFSVWEIWGALLHGGRLVVVPRDVVRDPGRFVDLLREERVTVLNQTPSAFRQLAAFAAEDDPRLTGLALRAVVFGGERLDMGELTPWIRRFGTGRPRLINMYGITETTVHTTLHEIRPGDHGSPIGVPLADLRVHLLDEYGGVAPVGVPGEIYVEGPGVARGYLNRPALTAERFLPAAGGGRLYRSGDLARRNADGSLEFLGRADDQVKIRGYRIELGEIQASLLGHPSVRDAVVVVRDQALVGYVEPAGDSIDVGELKTALGRALPDYMVPAAIIALDRIPLTVNGKLDRAALPAPGREETGAAGFVAPRNAVETLLAEIWQEVLGIDKVGARDDFFALGGNSLQVLKMIARVQEELDLELGARQVFEQSELAMLAGHIEAVLLAEDFRAEETA
ncbi:non-ribosomal peptide synthetase [Nonomuraea sp. SBT364]|uniref:non-ribosomal peptide synthetase n=1 Tax=Nonomuraea sp. SBT364 TaxID=1580530 RepID=UPI00066D4593|nr:non-ribosomal peptide synthetase [Nonomuraea sp. SBT364]